MIKDAEFARREMSSLNNPQFVFSFVENTNPVLTEEQRKLLPIPQLTQKQTAVFPKHEPMMVAKGLFLTGNIPKNYYQAEQVQRDWTMIQQGFTHVQEAPPMLWPEIDKPILVVFKNRRGPVEGVMVTHHISNEDGEVKQELVFMEHIRNTASALPMSCTAMIKYGKDGNVINGLFVPQVAAEIVCWTYLTEDGTTVEPKANSLWEPLELFISCKYDSDTDKLLSMGIVAAEGKIYYAYDVHAIDDCAGSGHEHTQEKVIPVLLEVPLGTDVWDVREMNSNFYKWFEHVFNEERGGSRDVRIHLTGNSHMRHVLELMRYLPKAEAIKGGRTCSFVLHDVQSYPTLITNAQQHNAAYDAVVLWHHLGYYAYKVMRDIADQEMRKKRTMHSRKEQPEQSMASYLTNWLNPTNP